MNDAWDGVESEREECGVVSEDSGRISEECNDVVIEVPNVERLGQ